MISPEKFTCPSCQKKISTIKLFQLKNLKVTIHCNHCNTLIKPETSLLVMKIWNSSFFIGVFSGYVPTQIILYYYDDLWLGLHVGFAFGVIVILILMAYFRNNIYFKEV